MLPAASPGESDGTASNLAGLSGNVNMRSIALLVTLLAQSPAARADPPPTGPQAGQAAESFAGLRFQNTTRTSLSTAMHFYIDNTPGKAFRLRLRCLAMKVGRNAFGHHGVVAELAGDQVRGAGCYDVSFALDQAQKTLEVRGQLEQLPLAYRHVYHFLPDRLSVETRVEAVGDVAARWCYLQFPLPASKNRAFHLPASGEPTRSVTVNDGTGARVALRFAEPVIATLGQKTAHDVTRYEVRQLKNQLPSR